MKQTRSKTMTWLLMGAAAVAAGMIPSAAHAQNDNRRSGQTAQLTGRVYSLDRNDTEFEIERTRDSERIVVRANGALITNRNDRSNTRFRLSDLRRGELVDVYGTWVDRDTVRATRVERSQIIDRDRDDRWDDRWDDNDRRGRRGNGDRDRWDDFERGGRRGSGGRDRLGEEGRTRNGLIGSVVGTTGNITRILQIEADGRNYSVEVPRNITVYRDERSVSVHHLQENDRVRVRGEWRNDRLVAETVEAFTRDSYGGRDDYNDRDRRIFTGIVERVDSRNERFRLRASTRTYEVDARDADVRDGSRRSRFSDLRAGDRVTVYASQDRGTRLQADRIQLNTRSSGDDRDSQVTLGGVITDLDTYNRTFRVRLALGTMLVRVSSAADIQDRRGRRVSFGDLRNRDRVRVIGSRDRNSAIMVANRVELID